MIDDVTQCRLIDKFSTFRSNVLRQSSGRLKIVAAGSSETSVPVFETKQRLILEYRNYYCYYYYYYYLIELQMGSYPMAVVVNTQINIPRSNKIQLENLHKQQKTHNEYNTDKVKLPPHQAVEAYRVVRC
jgi:hypothetical protein